MRHASSHALWVMLGIAAPAVATPVDTNLQLWLDGADASTLADGEGDNPGDAGFDGTVQTWLDKSGNSNHATALNPGERPIYSPSTFNNQAAVTFNSGNAASDPPGVPNVTTQAFALTSNINTGRETMFFALRMFNNGDNKGVWLGSTNSSFTNDANRYFISVANQNGIINSPPATNAPQSLAVVTGTRDPLSTANGQFTVYRDSANVGTYTGTAGDPMTLTMTTNRIGTRDGVRYYYGQMAEVIIYNATLNTAERVITENYLSSKYDSVLAANDKYLGDTNANGDHDFDVLGIGEDAAATLSPAGSLATSSAGGIALTELSGSLDTGDYALAGHSGEAHGFTGADLPATSDSRWARDYYLDVTGTLDGRLTFDFGDAGLGLPDDPDGYTLLYRATPAGAFTDTGLAGVVSGDGVNFDLFALNTLDDGFYTIGTAVIPEPASIALLGLCAAPLLWGRRRR